METEAGAAKQAVSIPFFQPDRNGQGEIHMEAGCASLSPFPCCLGPRIEGRAQYFFG